ncbi:MAG: metallophosphatase family protein [Actinomycetia bacterium]|nr:metallophosphatase family protein [Actinomycetes bacterium]
MRVAALYDVHAMPWALEAVLAEVDADAIVFGGDFLGGPFAEATVELIGSVEATLIRGNADESDPRFAALPLTAVLDGVTYCHATPTDNNPITTAATPDEAVLRAFGASGTFVIGHTHHQFDRRIGDLRVINAGSVGMAYESEVAAFWTLVEDGEPTFRKTPFDIERAVRELRAADWEDAHAFIDENLLVAVSREEAIAALEGRRT